MALDPNELEWRYARLADAEDMRVLYCESIDSPGHLPVVKHPTLESLQWLVNMCWRCGFPIWVLRKGGRLVAWATVRSIVWGPEVCTRTGDFALYVAREFQRQGVPIHVIRMAYRDLPKHGFTSITCWIFSSNRRSLTVARAFRLDKWGHMPGIADVGGLEFDIEIWGIRLDDPKWVAYMKSLDERHGRRQRRLFGEHTPA